MAHNRKMKKIVGKGLIISFLAISFVVVFAFSFVLVKYLKYKQLPVNAESLSGETLAVNLFSKDGKKMETENIFGKNFCKIEDLKEETKNAFISIEDKEFYHHNGINKKRILKASLNNLKSFSFKEGASTITQQLVKNTHLTSEKTLDRKLKEIALAQNLEKQFSKEEILESYLNIIFFGNNCYGIEDAANYYFDKSAKELNLQESCTLAGIIKSPSKYNPIKNYDNALSRRNLVLDEMEKDGHITSTQKIQAKNSPIELHITKKDSNFLNSYSQSALEEASEILGMPIKNIALSNYKIHTYFDEKKQKILEDSLESKQIESVDNAGIVINNSLHAVVAYKANSNLKFFDIKRQPASCLKPILVYAPALNENVISPSTQILDEPIEIENYKPENVNKKFSGYMSVQDAVKNSVNIPAIKVLSYIGIETGKDYAQKMGIDFDEKDTSFTLALGGMTYGTTLCELTTAYTTFANDGNYAKSSFIEFITDKNDKIIYLHKPQEKMVLRSDSNFLMLDILKETAKSGTAKKLSEVKNTEIASKTGTAGKRKGNTDAYNISVTPEETIGVWFGTLDNTPKNIAGGNAPTSVACEYIKKQEYKKTEFEIPSTVCEMKIDSLTKEKEHRIVLASPFSPERYTETAKFSRFNTPNEISNNFVEKPNIDAQCTEENGQYAIELQAERQINYQIYQNEIPYQNIVDKEGKIKIYLPQKTEENEIKIVAKYNLKELNNNLINEKIFKMSKNTKNTINKGEKWYI